mgnify:CR=1 FL=1
MRKQFNVRLPDLTQKQLDELTLATGMTTTQVVILAIERTYRQLVEGGAQFEAPAIHYNHRKSPASPSTTAQD